MSFINCGEKVFGPPPKGGLSTKVKLGKMQAASSFADPRAWSSDPRKQAAFIMDSMMRPMSASSGEDIAIKDGKNVVNGNLQRKRPPADDAYLVGNLDDTDCEIMKLKNKLAEAKEKIEELQCINLTMANDRTKTAAEVGNLRSLVSDMREQLQCLEEMKDKPTNDAAQSALEEAKLEIAHLTEKVEIYSDMRQWHSELRRVHDDLLQEKKELARTVGQLVSEKTKFANELKSKEKRMAALESRHAARDTSEKAEIVLRSRLAGKDEQIQGLKVALDERVAASDGLNAKIVSLTECFDNKEENLTQEIKDLRKTVEGQSAVIEQLQTKLHETELLVAELEALRDQLRKTNSALTDSVSSFQVDLVKTRRNSDELLSVVKRLQEEKEEKEKEIDNLTLFPHSPNTMLYFCHLNKLVMSTEETDVLSQEHQSELWQSVKGVIVKLKEEMWGSNITPLELQFQDVLIQTDCNRRDYELQCCPEVRSAVAQTIVPLDYTTMLEERQQFVAKMCVKVVSLEASLHEKTDEFDSLETSLFEIIEDNYLKEVQLEQYRSRHDSLLGAVELLSSELKQTEALLIGAVKEVESQVEGHQSLRDVMDSAIECTVEQYSAYLSELERHVRRKDDYIANLESWAAKLETGRDKSEELKEEIGRLMVSLNDKCRQVETLEVKFSSVLTESPRSPSRADAWTDAPTVARHALKKVLAKQAKEKNQFEVKLRKASRRLRREKRREVRLNVKFAEEKAKLGASCQELQSENSVLLVERHILVQELCSLKMKLTDLAATVDKYKAKQVAHSELKMKMEKMALKLMKKVTKYKTALNEVGEGSFGLSDNLNYEVDQLKTDNMNLSTTICDLKQKLSMLLELPEKESDSGELSGDPLAAVKTHYEELVLTMKREHDTASEEAQRQNMNSLKALKSSYERDAQTLRQSHSDSLDKLQTMHQEELDFVRLTKLQLELNEQKAKLEEEFAAETSSLQARFENSLKLQETTFENEKQQLEAHFQAQSDVLLETIENMKISHKNKTKELKEMHRNQLDLFDQRLELEVENRINLKKEAAVDEESQCFMVERETRGTDPDSTLNTSEFSSNTETPEHATCSLHDVHCHENTTIKRKPSSAFISSGDLMMFPEKAILFSRIADLETSLQAQHVEFARKIKHNEKKLKHEQMKTKEIALILDQELKYSTDVHCKLGVQFNRAEQLKLEKEALASHLLLCEEQLSQIRRATKEQRHQLAASQREEMFGKLGTSEEFERSLSRLREKIDQAAEQDKVWTTIDTDELSDYCESEAPTSLKEPAQVM